MRDFLMTASSAVFASFKSFCCVVSAITQLKNALSYCINADKETFKITEFIDLFWREAGLKGVLIKSMKSLSMRCLKA